MLVLDVFQEHVENIMWTKSVRKDNNNDNRNYTNDVSITLCHSVFLRDEYQLKKKNRKKRHTVVLTGLFLL